MEQNPSWEANSHSSSNEIFHLLRVPNVHCRFHKHPPLVPILSQTNPVHTHLTSLRFILRLSSHLRLRLPSGFFASGFQTKISYAFLMSPMRVTCPSYLILFDLITLNNSWWSMNVMKLFIMQYSSASPHFLPLTSKYSPQHSVLKHPQSMFFPYCDITLHVHTKAQVKLRFCMF
jgi:hypothetical protein